MAGGAKLGQRFGGRGKGTPNKSTVALRDLIAHACGPDWDPVVEMAKIAKTGMIDEYAVDPTTGTPVRTGNFLMADPKTRSTCRKEVAEYIHPKRRAIELSNDEDNPVGVFLNVVFDEPKGEDDDQ